MPLYVVVTPLRHGRGTPTPPDDIVELDADDGDRLVPIGALEHAPEDAVASPIAGTLVTDAPLAGQGEGIQLPGGTDGVGAPLSPVAKPLADMKRPELVVEAEKAGVAIAVGMTNKQVVAAIEAKRAETGA